MSTLTIAVGVLSAAAGAAAMYIPARLARYDAATYRELAERKLDECEARDAAVEATRNLPWHYAAELPSSEVCRTNSIAPHGPVVAHDRNGEPRCQMCAEVMGLLVDGEVLDVEHPTGEIPIPAEQFDELVAGIDEADLAPRLTVLADEVGLAQALSDRPADDEDIVGDEQPGEAWFAGLSRLWQRAVGWFRSLGASRRERHLIGSGEQATSVDPFAELLSHVAAEPVTIVHRSHRYRDPGMTGQFPLVKVVGDKAAGRHRAEVVIPAQRDGGDM